MLLKTMKRFILSLLAALPLAVSAQTSFNVPFSVFTADQVNNFLVTYTNYQWAVTNVNGWRWQTNVTTTTLDVTNQIGEVIGTTNIYGTNIVEAHPSLTKSAFFDSFVASYRFKQLVQEAAEEWCDSVQREMQKQDAKSRFPAK